MLDKRAQILLKTLVERYISEGQPIGSRTLSKYSGLDLSPASIRNVMADLEEMGFIASPHTSAGRIPTPMGYRIFVDSLLTVQPLQQIEVNRLENQLDTAKPQLLISSASRLLSDLTKFAGVVMSTKRSVAIRQLEFLKLSDTRILLIIITSDGNVQNRIILTEKNYSPAELVEATNFFNQNYAGRTFEAVKQKIHDELAQLRQDMTLLMTAAMEAGSEALDDSQKGCVISGESNLLHVEDLSSNLVHLRKLFGMFDQKTELLNLLNLGQHAQGVQIFIGGESENMPVDECSMITAPYEANGQVVGVVGVIGPTRMAYDRVIPIVDITARLLSSALSYH